MYNVEETVSLQHEILRGVSVTAGWYHREYFNLRRRFNTGVSSTTSRRSRSTARSTASPITYYNVSAAKASQLRHEPR